VRKLVGQNDSDEFSLKLELIEFCLNAFIFINFIIFFVF